MDTKKRALLQALEKTLGVVTAACEKSGVSRSAHYKWVAEDDEYRKAVESISDMAIDFAESKLYQLISGGDTSATIFYLKTKAKARGYVERTDITSNGNTIAVAPIAWSDE
jgi:hypothetical protein